MDIGRYMSLKARIQAVENKQSIIKFPYTEVLEKVGKNGGSPMIIQKSTSLGLDKDSAFGEYAIVSRECIDLKGEVETTNLEIQSEIMRKALQSIVGRHSQVGISADPIIFRKPYYPLFHCRREIRRMADDGSNTQEQKQHLKWLTDYMSENFKPLEKIQEGLVDKGLIEFKHLPIIFEAGSIVVGQLQGGGEKTIQRDKMEQAERPECFLFREIGGELEDSTTGTKFMDIEVLRWGYNGFMFGLTAETLRIKEFPGPRNITELECFPLKYLDDEKKNLLIPKLIDRGKKWCDYVEAKNLQYKGVAQTPVKSKWSWEVKLIPKNMPGRVLLDHLAFIEVFPELSSPLYNKGRQDGEENEQAPGESLGPADVWELSSQITLPKGDLWNCFDKKDYHPTEAHALLCPASSAGYSLLQKDWGYFDIDLLEDVDWASNPIRELELPPLQKEMLHDLIVEHHSKLWSSETALVKGEGLIFLLYGPPGCGKTLTAELMAEEERIALLRISFGDLGQHPYEVERTLQALFKLALRGSAIVLIDEADTFLSKRSSGGGQNDYFHNAIVSTFLKHLEYFPGAIFLTTNQETDIDAAVSSRVIRLRYDRLKATSRTKIWKQQLSKGERIPAEESLSSLCEELGQNFELDGREIKTLANLSLTICRRRKLSVSKEIIQQLYELTHGTRQISP